MKVKASFLISSSEDQENSSESEDSNGEIVRNSQPAQCRGAQGTSGIVFDEIFSDDMWDMIVQEINRYHEQEASAQPNKHKTKWNPVSKEEIKTFIGITIFMGIVKLPLEDHWSSDVLIHQQTVSNLMPYVRFVQISGVPWKGRRSCRITFSLQGCESPDCSG